MKCRLPLVLLVLLLSSCRAIDGTTSDPSIIGGQPTASYPAVGQLLNQNGSLCTATLIGPREVLTAGHCLDGQRASAFVFRVASGSSSKNFAVQAIAVHPQYGAPDKGAFHDIGRVTLVEAPPIAALELYEGDMQGVLGQNVINIGYGVTNADSGVGLGQKRSASSRLTEVRETTLRTESSRSHICDGDSGGPLLYTLGGKTVVLGVASYVDLNCARYSIYTRVDRHRAFIQGAQDVFPCGRLTEMGMCQGNVRSFCQSNKVVTQTCSAPGQRCDWDDDKGVYACVTQ